MTQEKAATPYRPSRKIVLVIFHEAKSLDVIGPMQVFNDAVRVSAGIDLALALVERDLGHPTALGLARDLVLFLKRPGGQSQFSVELRRQTQDARGRFDGLHAWMRANLQSDLSGPELAAVAPMSPRNFARVYTRETGESPARAVEQMRVEEARRLLESTHDTIQTIANRGGFGDDERLRRAFVKSCRLSPHDYRIRLASDSH